MRDVILVTDAIGRPLNPRLRDQQLVLPPAGQEARYEGDAALTALGCTEDDPLAAFVPGARAFRARVEGRTVILRAEEPWATFNVFLDGTHVIAEGRAIGAGRAHLIVRGSARAGLTEGASGEFLDEAQGFVRGDSTAVARDAAEVESRDRSSVNAVGAARVYAYDRSRVDLGETSWGVGFDAAQLRFRDTARGEVHDRARFTAQDDAQIGAHGAAHGMAHDRATVVGHDTVCVHGVDHSCLIGDGPVTFMADDATRVTLCWGPEHPGDEVVQVAQVIARGAAAVSARGAGVRVHQEGRGTLLLADHARAHTRGPVRVTVETDAEVVSAGGASVTGHDAQVTLDDGSRAVLTGRIDARVRGSAKLHASDGAGTIRAEDDARVAVRRGAFTVAASGASEVDASGPAFIAAVDRVRLHVTDSANALVGSDVRCTRGARHRGEVIVDPRLGESASWASRDARAATRAVATVVGEPIGGTRPVAAPGATTLTLALK
ncbi:MAG: hypothetical protein ACHQQR_00510 [Gemmatimonadales bacterium]